MLAAFLASPADGANPFEASAGEGSFGADAVADAGPSPGESLSGGSLESIDLAHRSPVPSARALNLSPSGGLDFGGGSRYGFSSDPLPT